jgi:antitoxin component of MazEF toxin-antitoxin module
MKKIIKKYGSSFVIRITPEEMKVYGLNLGDIIDIEIKPNPERKFLSKK